MKYWRERRFPVAIYLVGLAPDVQCLGRGPRHTMRMLLIITAGFLGIALIGAASPQTAAQDMKRAGHESKEAAKDVGKGTAKAVTTGAKKTRRGVKKGAHAVAEETREGAEKVERKTAK